mmetsp:Transcript_146648/g.470565  ORF Transcript_146648/g.470565 Transcript_146648/m.470565 type:complete len:597 (+) Transcript_146648:182-1972(+)
MVWQANVAKFVAVITCLVAGVVALSSLAITRDPRGPETGDQTGVSWTAVWIVRLTAGVLMVVVAGIFYERQALSEKLPKFPRAGRKRDLPLLLVLILPLIVPVVHLGYQMTVVVLLLWLLLTRLAKPLSKLRGVAALDGVVCVVLSLVMLRAGPTSDYGPARILVACYAGAVGALFPGITIVASLVYAPKLARLACWSYALAALHAATVIIQAVGNYVYQVLDDQSPVYSNEQCFPAWDSVLGVFMNASSKAIRGIKRSDGMGTSLPPCAVEETLFGYVGPPCDPIKWYVVLISFLLGLWLAAAVTLQTFWKQPVRVAPSEDEDTRARKVKKVANAKKAAAGALVVLLIGILIPGYYTFWLCPDEGNVRSMPAVEVVLPNTSTTTNTTTTISSTTTSSSSSTWTSTASSTVSTTTTDTTTYTGSTMSATFVSNSTNDTNGTNDTIAEAPMCDDKLPSVDMSGPAPAPPPRSGCRCGESPAHPFWAWMAVPAEQLASTWCDIGNAAPVIIFIFLYGMHCYVCSMMYEQLSLYTIKEREIAFHKKMTKLRVKAFKKGVSIEQLTKESKNNNIQWWKESERDDSPKPVAELGEERLFNV